LIKSKMASRWAFVARAALVVAAFGCFLFVAFCWTTNHLLSIAPDSWTTSYASGSVIGSYFALAARLSIWVCGAFPTMCVLAAWQLAYRKPASEAEEDALALEPKRLAYIAATGLLLAVVFSLLYLMAMGVQARGAVLGPAGQIWIGVLGIGIVAQAAVWWVQRKEEDFRAIYLAIITVGSAMTLLATASLREVIRLSQVDLALLASHTSKASKVSGFVVFLIFAVINLGLIGLCIWLAKRGYVAAQDESSSSSEKDAADAPLVKS